MRHVKFMFGRGGRRAADRSRRPAVSPDIVACADAFRPAPAQLPQLLRKAWVGVEARRRHDDTMRRAAEAWEIAEWRWADVARPCALVSLLPAEYTGRLQQFEAAGLAVAPLRVLNVAPDGSDDDVHSVEMVIGSRRNVRKFRAAWIDRNDDALGALLGYPACCRAFFDVVFVSRQLGDPGWLIARNTPAVEVSGTTLSVAGDRETNILLRRMGIRAVPHFPCSFGCEPSRRLSRAMTETAASHGRAADIDRLHEILDWPAAWSALHGIAEIKTPVVKFVTHTDVTTETHAVKWLGQSMPDEAAMGLDFPYRRPAR